MHLTDSQIAAYPEYIQEGSGGGSYDNFPSINEPISQKSPNAPLRLGQVIFDRDGKGYIYARATAALVKGDVCAMSANITGTVQTADATGNNIQVIKTDFAGLTLNGEKGNWILFAAGGLATVWRRIKRNTATSGGVSYVTISEKNTLAGLRGYDPDAPAAAIAGTTAIQLYRPNHVAVCGAGGYPVGISRGAVDSGNCTLLAMHGLHLVKAVGTTDALTDNGPVVTAASGNVKGPAGAGMSGLEAFTAVGVAKFAHNGASALVPCFVNLMGHLG